MTRRPTPVPEGETGELTGRQAAVLRAVVTAYVSEAAPVGSAIVSQVLPTRLSSASVRSTLAELAEAGLVDQPHTSAGRIPTARGLRLFIDRLLDPSDVAEYHRRTIAYGVDEADADSVVHVASQLLSDCTRQLGFVVAPRIERVVLRHVSLVRLSSERVLAVLVSWTGAAHRSVLEDREIDQPGLEQIAALLNERVTGRTLSDVRAVLESEARTLRHKTDRLLAKALEFGVRAIDFQDELEPELIIESRRALLDQPEFRDPERIRELFEAVETKERLLEVLDRMLEGAGVCVAIGDEVADPALHHCALVVTPYGDRETPIGALGVIGPSRMDYGRVIPLVDHLSRVLTDKLNELNA